MRSGEGGDGGTEGRRDGETERRRDGGPERRRAGEGETREGRTLNAQRLTLNAQVERTDVGAVALDVEESEASTPYLPIANMCVCVVT
jgi:hypothetical protein